MALKVEPALSEATRQTDFRERFRGARAGTWSGPKNAESPCPLLPGFVSRKSERSKQDALSLNLGRGGSRYCSQGRGLAGPESRGRRKLSFVSGFLALLLPSAAGF